MTEHKFPYRWTLKDAIFTKDKGTVFSCFACGGGSTMGYKLAGFDVIGCNEIDPKMMEAYRKNHNPKYSFLEPIQTFKLREDLPQELFELDILDGSPPCFEKGTLIMTETGLKAIELIEVGEKVLTHENRFMPVLKTMQKESLKALSLKVQGCLPIVTTNEHPFYVVEMNRVGKFGKRVFSNPVWKAAKDLTIKKNTSNSTISQDYIGISINQKSEIPKWEGIELDGKLTNTLDLSNIHFWYLIGRYLGDGWLRFFENDSPKRYQPKYQNQQMPCQNCGNPSKRHSRWENQWTAYCSEKCRTSFKGANRKPNRADFIICCSKSEKDSLASKFIKSGFSFGITEQRTTFRFSISSKELCTYVQQFSRGAKNKRLTSDILNLPIDLLESFLDGYLDADGHFDVARNKYSCSSISKELIFGIQACVHKVHKVATTIAIKDNPKYASKIEGRDVNTNMAYSLQFCKHQNKQQHYIFKDGHLWVPFRKSIEIDWNSQVYNLSVSGDESYSVFNLICHNCSNFSMAGNREKDWGKEKVFREGQAKQVLDTLFFDFIDLAKRLQPKVVIAENVKGLLLGNAKNYVRQIYRELDLAGYYVQHWLLDASKMGVPQRRERVFFIALRKDLAKPFLKQMDLFTIAPELELKFKEKKIPFKEIEIFDEPPLFENPAPSCFDGWQNATPGQKLYSDKKFDSYKIDPKKVLQTITASLSKSRSGPLHYKDFRMLTKSEVYQAGTFPIDYDCCDPYYFVGMSVPPVVTAQIATKIYEQWLSKIN